MFELILTKYEVFHKVWGVPTRFVSDFFFEFIYRKPQILSDEFGASNGFQSKFYLSSIIFLLSAKLPATIL